MQSKRRIILYTTKRAFAVLLCVILLAALFGCGDTAQPNEKEKSDKLSVVCTLFPQYDFVRQIGGDNVEAILLLTPGTDSHSYDPSPQDIIRINDSDLFVYTGDLMEGWAANVISSVGSSSLRVLNVSEGLELSAVEHHDDDEDEHDTHEHEHSVDPHVWTSPVNAKKIVKKIADALCDIDPDNAAAYRTAAEEYTAKLDSLDGEIRATVSKAANREIIVCDRFAMHYFCHEYSIDYLAAFDSCTTDTEPSPAVIVRITDEVKAENIPAVFYAELSNRRVAQSVSERTGVKMLELHSCHNLSAEDFAAGATYLSLMQRNAENIKIALGVS